MTDEQVQARLTRENLASLRDIRSNVRRPLFLTNYYYFRIKLKICRGIYSKNLLKMEGKVSPSSASLQSTAPELLTTLPSLYLMSTIAGLPVAV
jgi:hypothetical protein